MSAVEALCTPDVLSALFSQPEFGVGSFVALGSTCRRMYEATLASDAVWKALLNARFPTNAFYMYELLEPYVALTLGVEPTASYRDHLRYLCQSVSQDAALAGNMQALSLSPHTSEQQQQPPVTLNDLVAEAHEHLQQFQSSGGNADELIAAASKLLRVAYVYPFHPAVYHLLGVIAYICGALAEGLQIAQMAVALDDEFEEARDLCNELCAQLAQQDSSAVTVKVPQRVVVSAAEAPVAGRLLSSQIPPVLAPAVRSALAAVFSQYDKDGDAAWSDVELGTFIEFMNGARPSQAFLRHFAGMFGCNRRGYLTLDGLCEFYLQQSLNEPEETLRDLAKLGVHL
ncbi:hypothetical protein RI367_004163 [Sorochytrium milnesiophthora]